MKTLKKVQLLVMALIVAVGVSSCDEKKSKSRDDDKEETEETEKVKKGEDTEEPEKVKNEFNTGSDVLDEGLRRLNRVCLKGQKADSCEELDEIRKKYGEEFRAWEQKNIEILDSVYEIEDAFYKFDAEIEKMQNAFLEKLRSLIEKEEKEAREQNMAELPEIEEDVEEFLPPPPPPEEVIASEEVCGSLLLCGYYKIYYYREGRRDDILEDIYREYITDEKLLEKKLERIYGRR